MRRVRIGVQGQDEDESVRWVRVRVRVMRFCQGVNHPSIGSGRGCVMSLSGGSVSELRGDHPSINQVRVGRSIIRSGES